MLIYAINIGVLLIALAIFHVIDQPLLISSGFAVLKLITYFSLQDYPWWGSIIAALFIYALAGIYFWLLSLTRGKPYTYWTILIVGVVVFIII